MERADVATPPTRDVDIHAPGFLADPQAAFARLRAECPVARSDRHGGYWHPDARDRLAREPALVPSAVEEFLRHATPIQVFGRNATRDLALHGRMIPEGCVVALGFGGANADPEAFEAPEEVRLDRHPNRHLAFGAGPHLCAGAGVARMEMAVTLAALGEGGLRVAPDPDDRPTWKARGDRRGLARLPLLIASTDRGPAL